LAGTSPSADAALAEDVPAVAVAAAPALLWTKRKYPATPMRTAPTTPAAAPPAAAATLIEDEDDDSADDAPDWRDDCSSTCATTVTVMLAADTPADAATAVMSAWTCGSVVSRDVRLAAREVAAAAADGVVRRIWKDTETPLPCSARAVSAAAAAVGRSKSRRMRRAADEDEMDRMVTSDSFTPAMAAIPPRTAERNDSPAEAAAS
jgi:hypothetical protein